MQLNEDITAAKMNIRLDWMGVLGVGGDKNRVGGWKDNEKDASKIKALQKWKNGKRPKAEKMSKERKWGRKWCKELWNCKNVKNGERKKMEGKAMQKRKRLKNDLKWVKATRLNCKMAERKSKGKKIWMVKENTNKERKQMTFRGLERRVIYSKLSKHWSWDERNPWLPACLD